EDLLEPNSFDLVFTSYGVLGWLNSLVPWAKSIHRYLKPGGMFYITDLHPFAWVLDDENTSGSQSNQIPLFPSK
ncbi:MAG: methyltransferase domain-containing protein, partial [Candidatus Heimdallarchaeota archaeon]|nr:methyltransferase domain-containing protein [Candidatus Heimdallarchaeota archaeon]